MAYIELTDLKGSIPANFYTPGLDDDGDGVVDAWSEVSADVDEAIDALLEGRFEVPLTLQPLPRTIKVAAKIFACELLYRRRNTPDDQNPWFKLANGQRTRLASITAGELKLSVVPNADAVTPDAAASVVLLESGLGRPDRMLG